MFKKLAFLSLLGFNCAQANYSEYINPTIRIAAVVGSFAAGTILADKGINWGIKKLENKKYISQKTAQILSWYSYLRLLQLIPVDALVTAFINPSSLNLSDPINYGIFPFLIGLCGNEANMFIVIKHKFS